MLDVTGLLVVIYNCQCTSDAWEVLALRMVVANRHCGVVRPALYLSSADAREVSGLIMGFFEGHKI